MAFAGHDHVDEYVDDAVILTFSDPRRDDRSRSRDETDSSEESVQQDPRDTQARGTPNGPPRARYPGISSPNTMSTMAPSLGYGPLAH